MTIDIHHAAMIFPMLDEASYVKLRDDIATNGLREWGMTLDGKIIDGRNRYRACQELGKEMDFMELDEDKAADPLSYVISANLHRRHLSTKQRAIVGARMATLGHGQHKSNGDMPNGMSYDDTAGLLGVSVRSIARAKDVLENGHPKLIELVEQDRVSVSLASKFIREVPEQKEQAKIVKLGVEAIKATVPGKSSEKPSGWKSELIVAFSKARDRKQAIELLYEEFTAEDISQMRKLVNGD